MRLIIRSLLAGALAMAGAPEAFADDARPVFSTGASFDQHTGEALYSGICQGCHMANAQGAAGAGRYPSLAANQKLQAAGYPVTVLLRGLNGMPPVGQWMSDQQVAQVVNYVRTHFGNDYGDPVKPEDVKLLR